MAAPRDGTVTFEQFFRDEYPRLPSSPDAPTVPRIR